MIGRYCKQHGAVTLLFTAMILASALILTFGSYYQLFYQAKRVQNEVQARQSYWKAQGRLACVLTQVTQFPLTTSYSRGLDSIDLSGCDTPSSIQLTQQANPRHYNISSQGEGYKIQATLALPGLGFNAAVVLNSDAYFFGEFNFRPFVSYQGYVANPNAASSNFDVFNQIFANEKSNLLEIKQKFSVIQGGLCREELSNPQSRDPSDCQCDKQLAQQISLGNQLIWVEGDCDIGLGTHTYFADQTQGASGIMVVIHDGLFSSLSAVPFHGIFYQLYESSINPLNISQWDKMTGRQSVSSFYNDFARVPVSYVSSTTQSTSSSHGVVVIDATEQIALFEGPISFNFDESFIEIPLRLLSKPKWLKGSWHDF